MVNNFDKIENLMYWKEGEFYFIQILQRKKDGHSQNGNNHNRLIKAYFVESKEYLQKIKQEIIDLCTVFNARAMIHLTRRSYHTIALENLSLCVEMLKGAEKGGNINHMYRAYHTAVGRSKGVKRNRSWIIDVDNVNEYNTLVQSIIYRINRWRPNDTGLESTVRKVVKKVITVLPSNSGVHIITLPFDLSEFKIYFPDIEIHKNNPTNLYIP